MQIRNSIQRFYLENCLTLQKLVMSNEIKEWNAFTSLYLKVLAAVILTGFLIWGLSSCNTTKHTTASQTNIDTSKTIQSVIDTHTKVDSNTTSHSASNVDFTDSTITQSKNDYNETTTTYFGRDTLTGKTYKIKTETTKKGTKTKTENKNQKLKANTVDTTVKTASAEVKQKENKSINQVGKSEVKTATKDKTVKVSPIKFGIGIGIFVAFCVFVFFVWRKFKSKII